MLVAMVAQPVDDVDLPARGAIFRIGGIQRGFLIRVVGVFLAQFGEGRCRPVERNCLG